MFNFEFFNNPILVGMYSLLMGSFLTACIYRIPYGRPKGIASLEADEEVLNKELKESTEKISIFKPTRSFCPICKNQLSWWQNIPVISWVILRGKCFFCKTSISLRYPLVELLSLAFALLSYYCFNSWTAVFIYLFCCSLIVISFIDIDYYIIPDVISLPGIVIGLVIAVANYLYGFLTEPFVQTITSSLFGLLVGGGFLWGVSELYYRIRKKVGLGFGDVKLMAMAGVFFGPSHIIEAIFLGSLAGSILGVMQLMISKKGVAHPIPFGPYLAMGIILSIFVPYDFMQLFIIR